jgi:hypothetical protein
MITAFAISGVLALCSIGMICAPAASGNVGQFGFIGLLLSIAIVLVGVLCG